MTFKGNQKNLKSISLQKKILQYMINQEKTVSEAIQYRRSVRIYDADKSIDKNIVKKCIQQATLAPNSSNMQLWEFYHITSKDLIAEIAPFCFNADKSTFLNQLANLYCYKLKIMAFKGNQKSLK
jgi:nitroreductase